ncbi:MAG: hypothetical protein GKC04_05870 [Methanomicrobiales archaeon]|nr:hypothetical protein [Methanomicrobiales archaeon]
MHVFPVVCLLLIAALVCSGCLAGDDQPGAQVQDRDRVSQHADDAGSRGAARGQTVQLYREGKSDLFFGMLP